MNMTVAAFESLIADFYQARFAVSVDCCTHAIELCLRHKLIKSTTCPSHTYISIPFTFKKLNIEWKFEDMP
jgi:dTDP-4-amino-4,6-dideoxygalactose transaminase